METVFALSTGPVPSGVAVIRLTGPLALSATAQLVDGPLPPPREAKLSRFVDPMSKSAIDSGLLLVFPAPNSFTGEDCAEFQVHGSRAVIAELSQCLVQLGLRPAEAGEFTRRAFLNDKLTLTQVEGLGDVLQAETKQQLRLAQMQTSGALAGHYEDWRSQLTQLRAELEAELDFSDEDLPDDLLPRVLARVDALDGALGSHMTANAAAERVRGGIKVVIAGPPNAGKSTLLNLLAQRDVAIVSDEPGTTRDSLEVHLDLGGYPVSVVDTAGLRDTTSKVEQEGISRAKAHLAGADIVVAMSAPGLAPVDLPSQPDIRLFNKADLVDANNAPKDWKTISLKTGQGMDDFLTTLQALVEDRFGWGEHVVTGHARHQAALRQARAALSEATPHLSPGQEDLVLAAEHLRQTAHHLGRIVGRTDVEDVLGAVFSSFCIGK